MWSSCSFSAFCVCVMLSLKTTRSFHDLEDAVLVNSVQTWGPSSPCPNFRIVAPGEELKFCHDDLGCVEINDDFRHAVHRPINLLPLPRHVINTRFTLHTRSSLESETLNADVNASITKSNFDPHKQTKFVIHGFIDNGRTTWIQKMVNNLLDNGDYYVIVVNWGWGSLPLYSQAAANTRIVGLEIAYLIKTLVRDFGLDPGKVHLIGHSLGAHTAGYAGKKLPGLGRITGENFKTSWVIQEDFLKGLDPAGPFFEDMPPSVRLDPTDAKFVDAIHTDAPKFLMLGFGLRQPVGHVDFYVNGGVDQPDCSPFRLPVTTYIYGFETAGRELLSCDHQRAIDQFISSLTASCNFVAYECADYDTYLKGGCYSCGEDNTHCAPMGMDADKYPLRNRTGVRMYLSTGTQPSFCMYHYHVTAVLAYPKGAGEWVRGILKISLYGTHSELEEQLLTDGCQTFFHGREKRFLLQSPVNVEKIVAVRLYWECEGRELDPLEVRPESEELEGADENTLTDFKGRWQASVFLYPYLYVDCVQVSQMHHYPELKRLVNTWAFFSSNGSYVALDDGASVFLNSTY